MSVIFLDTNCIRNKEVNSFFGGDIETYKRIEMLVDICVPYIVIEEIITQKLRYLRKQLENYKDNYFSAIINFDIAKLEEHIKDKINQLYHNADSEFIHEEIYLDEKAEHMEILKKWALKNTAPFGEKNDKGFKDAYIYLTITQYLEKNFEKEIFLITDDARLKQAFEKGKVKILSEPKEYLEHRKEYFQEDYFVGALRSYFGDKTIRKEHISKIELDDDDFWQMFVTISVGPGQVERAKFQILVEFDTKEIISRELVVE